MARYRDSCDVCNAESDAYMEWPYCRDCGNHVCPRHEAPNTLADDDGRLSCVCVHCWEESYEEEPPEEVQDVDFG